MDLLDNFVTSFGKIETSLRGAMKPDEFVKGGILVIAVLAIASLLFAKLNPEQLVADLSKSSPVRGVLSSLSPSRTPKKSTPKKTPTKTPGESTPVKNPYAKPGLTGLISTPDGRRSTRKRRNVQLYTVDD